MNIHIYTCRCLRPKVQILIGLFYFSTAGVVEVFGSWKKVAPHLESSVFDVDVEKQLEEAMTEHDSQSITVVATGATSAKTGFYTHDES